MASEEKSTKVRARALIQYGDNAPGSIVTVEQREIDRLAVTRGGKVVHDVLMPLDVEAGLAKQRIADLPGAQRAPIEKKRRDAWRQLSDQSEVALRAQRVEVAKTVISSGGETSTRAAAV